MLVFYGIQGVFLELIYCRYLSDCTNVKAGFIAQGLQIWVCQGWNVAYCIVTKSYIIIFFPLLLKELAHFYYALFASVRRFCWFFFFCFYTTSSYVIRCKNLTYSLIDSCAILVFSLMLFFVLNWAACKKPVYIYTEYTGSKLYTEYTGSKYHHNI